MLGTIMTQPIHFLAACQGYVIFGVAENPATRIREWQQGNPFPIKLLASWLVPPTARVRLLTDVERAFPGRLPRSDWFRMDAELAEQTVNAMVTRAGGKVWRSRRKPVAALPELRRLRPVVTPNGRFTSANAAAIGLGISRQAVTQNLLRRAEGWRYADDHSPQPPAPRRGRPPKINT
jgi:hypothetical protein